MGATKGGTRRKHRDEFREQVLSECRQPGKSISGVALKHGLNTNMVRAWLRKSELSLACQAITEPTATSSIAKAAELQQFVPVRLAVPEDISDRRSTAIQLELRRGNSTATVTWPSEMASECGVWLREWLR